jgi:hypothetical protein
MFIEKYECGCNSQRSWGKVDAWKKDCFTLCRALYILSLAGPFTLFFVFVSLVINWSGAGPLKSHTPIA